jgi:NADPH-dependent 2,4-dienoyl-CoA reductase/sulfur reductase-like enzyme/peroxiredoxin family protein/rhodanese-related sulfurtransferase/TusA-related sulfurtransferase
MAIKILIVGGVAGGASAAARLRRLDEHAEIIMFEKGDYISFANCGLPYYIGGTIAEKEKLLLQTPESFRKRFNVDVRVGSEVTKINTANKTVEVYDSKNGKKYTESYDKLILSPGAEPIKPSLPGIDSSRIFTLRNIPDTYKIKDFVDAQKPKRAVVIGAGFIGLETAENLCDRGVKTTVVELADHVIGPLDYEMAAIVHQHLKSKEVELYLKDGAKSFRETDSYIDVELNSGRTIKADMVVLGIGVKPETSLAASAGIMLGTTGGIKTDKYMRTSDPDIYAVGDAVEVTDFVSGKQVLIPLAGPANKQGRIAANNICGAGEEYEGTQGTSIVKVFDITVAITGNNERTLRKNGVDYEKSFTHSASHAGYYPGAIPMSIKLLFSKKDGKVLGAQIVGYGGVDKRIDVIATAIRVGMTVHDLEKLELAYAPPYSSAKDPVNIAGYVAANIVKGDLRVFHWDEVDKIDRSKSVLIDVRTKMEYELGTIEGSINIPLDEIRDRIHEIPEDKDIYLFCRVGLRAYIACRILMQRGYANVKNLSGGLTTYQPAVDKQGSGDIYEYDLLSENDETEPVSLKGGEFIPDADISIDACGLQCPGPIMQVYNYIKAMNYGEILKIKATDPAFAHDIKAWCASTGNRLVNVKYEESVFTAIIKKEKQEVKMGHCEENNGKTMVVFSNDLDKAIAAFIIANGAAAMGRRVTLFFTFWGLNILRKTAKVNVGKDILGKMFGFMMPRGSSRLSLSKMNMGGIGAKMIRFIMKKKNVLSLEELIEQAKANGVNLVACNMSMDIMGIRKEELIDGVQIGGVASFLASAEKSDMSLFI